MFTLGSKSLVINDASLVTVVGNTISIPGFGTIDKTDTAYTKVKTLGVLPVYSAIDLGTALLISGAEIAIYWENLRYIGEGMSNMSSTPQAPLVIAFPSTVSTIAEAWALHEEAFGTSELFEISGVDVLTSKNTAVNIVKSSVRTLIAPSVDVMTAQTGFRYNRFGGTEGVLGVTNGNEGVGNGTQVEESVRTSSFDATDPYSTRAHGSEEVELDAVYDIYDFTVQVMGAVETTASGLIAAVSITTAGLTYDTNGTFPATATGGTGTGATFSVTIAAGIVTNVVVTDPGTGYTATDVLTLVVSGSTPGTPATITVDATSSETGSTWDIHEDLAQHTPDENVINHPIQLRIYAKQGDASVPVDGF